MGRFWDVVAAGFLGGSFCALILLAPTYGFAFQPLWENLEPLFLFAVVLGGGFGIIAFPTCYYAFLTSTPPKLTAAVTIPSTIVVGFIGELFYLQIAPTWQNNSEWLLGIYGPSFLGLLFSSIALNRLASRVPHG